MNNHECGEEFHISYKNKELPVNVVCEGNDVHFLVHMPGREVKIVHDVDEEGRDYWIEDPSGETNLSTELGELIEYASYMTLETV